eukprot:Filipodium_phascolosomae@DN405_c0_g1_i1.p1
MDHIENTKGFSLSSVQYLVLDEADRLLSMDFEDTIHKVIQLLPVNRNTYLFSATMTSQVSKLQRASLHEPAQIMVNSKYDTVATLTQNYLLIPYKYKHDYLIAILHLYKVYNCIVFVATCKTAKMLSQVLGSKSYSISCECLHGQLSQSQRIHALNTFKSGQKKVIIATDVASRGLDLPCVDLVLNFEIPLSPKDYIHRVGRTARAGRTGRALTLVTQYDIEAFQKIEAMLGRKLEEFTDISEEAALGYHEEMAERLRQAELEIREEKISDKRKRFRPNHSDKLHKQRRVKGLSNT